MKKNKAVVGLSGGVDSTAAVLLLKDKGLEVTGVYLDVLGNNDSGRAEAFEIAGQLGIEMTTCDVSREFHETVIADFCEEYKKGATPNPCVRCNPLIKFKHLLNAADDSGAFFIATGHYADVRFHEEENCCFLCASKSGGKDQSYALYRLNQQVLKRLLLPLSGFKTKEDVRSYVASKGITSAVKRDSQEICFIPGGTHYSSFLEARGYEGAKGDFVDVKGRLIGKYDNICNFTVGQRKNLGMTFGVPMYVVKIDCEKNTVTLGSNEDLYSGSVFSKLNWFTKTDSGEMPEEYEGKSLFAKTRYTAATAEAVIKRGEGETVLTVFKNPQRAVTPGQSIVFYDGERLIGGGMIVSTL